MNKLLLLPALLLAGCASIQESVSPASSPVQGPAQDCPDLLADYATGASMGRGGWEGFVKDLQQRHVLSRDGCDQLRLALVYSQGRAAERAQALKLAEELLETGVLQEKVQARQLAMLLRDRLWHERKLRLRNLELQHRLSRQKARNKELLMRLKDLDFRLQQLKQIEQNINEKEQSFIAPAADKLPARSSPDTGGGR